MAPRVTRTSVDGLDVVVLENDALRVTVLPAIGAHVSELVDKAGGRDLLWHNPRTLPRPAPYGAYFDDWWSGGWDEIFPSGDSGLLHGERLPYMGEMWCVPWTAEIASGRDAASGLDAASVTTTGFGTIAPVRVERTLTLRDDEPVLTARYRITSLDVRPLPYTWGIHPVFAVTPDHRIDVPADRMLVGVSSDPSMGSEGAGYDWPSLPDPSAPGGLRDMRRARPRGDAVFGGHWATDLSAGWLALTDTAAHRGVAIAFDTDVFRHAWLWQVYGGWRGHHHVALEPWSSHPQAVDEAEAAGQARVLASGASIETEVSFVVFGGLDEVAGVDREGDRVRVR
jgi:hypothetical protein